MAPGRGLSVVVNIALFPPETTVSTWFWNLIKLAKLARASGLLTNASGDGDFVSIEGSLSKYFESDC